jgi:hypothetical protein
VARVCLNMLRSRAACRRVHFSVEATADLGLLVPALRVEGFHDALYASMSVARRAETTGHMLARLRNAIGADLTAVQSVEQRADERRRVRTAAAVTFVTTVAGTFGLLFGFFGINTVEIRPDRSIFDHRYAAIYLVIAGLIAAAGTLYLVLRALERRQTTRDRQWLGRLPTRLAKPADQPPEPPAEPDEPGAAASAIKPAGTDAHPINLEDRGQAEPGRDPRTAERTPKPRANGGDRPLS